MQNESKEAFSIRKGDKQVDWELFGTKIGSGDRYSVKFDGIQIRWLLKDDQWRTGVDIMDPAVDTIAVWEVTVRYLLIISGSQRKNLPNIPTWKRIRKKVSSNVILTRE